MAHLGIVEAYDEVFPPFVNYYSFVNDVSIISVSIFLITSAMCC